MTNLAPNENYKFFLTVHLLWQADTFGDNQYNVNKPSR